MWLLCWKTISHDWKVLEEREWATSNSWTCCCALGSHGAGHIMLFILMMCASVGNIVNIIVSSIILVYVVVITSITVFVMILTQSRTHLTTLYRDDDQITFIHHYHITNNKDCHRQSQHCRCPRVFSKFFHFMVLIFGLHHMRRNSQIKLLAKTANWP